MAIDVVCQMRVDEKTAKATSIFQGKTYYFCSLVCKKEFDKNPERFVKQQK